jgi:cytidylate kinase
MSIITISRGCYSRGKEVAEKVAQELGYQCISREILLEASEKFHIPEIKLVRAIHDAPSVFDRFTYGKEKYIAFLRSALLKNVQKDNVVYHGLAGHFFLQDIPHVLKVRVIADLENRVKEEMKRENISAEEARYILRKDDDERRKWGLQLYGRDTLDSSLYDLVVHILDDLTLAAELKAALVDEFPTSEVTAKDSCAFVKIELPISQQEKATDKIKQIAETVPGVKEVDVYVIPLIGAD